ncbi:MAG: proline dehydrogenase family protein [Gordonia sp. (in: high G+C Gram-positive bacteria)]
MPNLPTLNVPNGESPAIVASPLAADTLRGWALDEELKHHALTIPAVAASARRIAARYIAGESIDDALAYLAANAGRGHAFSVELVGESVRDAVTADAETEQFVDLAARLPHFAGPTTVSFDLSHIGSLVGPAFGLANALRIAEAADAAGSHLMISAEGSDRTDLVLDLFEQISDRFPATGITLQARLHRTPADLERVFAHPGPVRLVKGAFAESERVAFPRDSAPMTEAYLAMAEQLVAAGHRVNFATHDAELVNTLHDRLGASLFGDHVEFETLQGLGTALIDSLHSRGLATREYCVWGPQWWLYTLNRLAEQPERVLVALADLAPPHD